MSTVKFVWADESPLKSLADIYFPDGFINKGGAWMMAREDGKWEVHYRDGWVCKVLFPTREEAKTDIERVVSEWFAEAVKEMKEGKT